MENFEIGSNTMVEIKPLFAKKSNIPVIFVAKILAQTEKAVYLYGHGTIHSKKTGKCCACGRQLTHPVSVILGIGPECGKHYWNWDSIGGYDEKNIEQVMTYLQSMKVDQWIPKSVIKNRYDTNEPITPPADHKMLNQSAENMKPKEKKATQVQYKNSGIAAIKIEFPFDREILNEIKALPSRKYHPEGKYWTCPVVKENIEKLKELGFKLDEKLENYLHYKKPVSKVLENIEIPGFGGVARDYQKQGVHFTDMNNGNALIADEMGLGKEQPLYCKILTPNGWKKMGDIKIGDYVIGKDGSPTKVIGVFPQGQKESYEIIFTDGSRTECGLDHLWNVRDVNLRYKKKPFVTKTTKELLERGLKYSDGGNKWDIPLPDPIKFSKKDYLIHPYLLGVLIGDGYLSGSTIQFSNPKIDNDITERIKTLIPKNCLFVEDKRDQCPQHTIRGKVYKVNPILNEVRRLYLNVKSKDKFIPNSYKVGSIKQRLELVRGLMDTDGGNSTKGNCVFHTRSQQLAQDVVDIVRSLGGIAYIRQYAEDFQVPVFLNFCPFYTKRKKESWKQTTKQIGNSHGRRGKFIKEINYVGKVEQQCISVENEDGLYITDDYIVTHNTIQALGYLQLHPEIRPVLIVVPALVKTKWKREALKWLSSPGEVQILYGKTPSEPITGNIVIINYDIIYDWKDELAKIPFEVMITDECHLYSNNSAKRTKAVKKIGKKIPRVIGLSGTPISNKPIGIYNAVNLINPDIFPNYMLFGKKFCDGKHNGFGWDFSGSSNTTELHNILTSTVMIRRKKEDVLKELPPKTYSYEPLELDNMDDYRSALADFIGHIKATKGVEVARRAKNAETLQRIETLKQIAVEGKMRQCIEWIKDFLESGEKLVVFAWHTNFIHEIHKHFPDISVVVDGSTPDKDKEMDKFQNDPNCKLFIGQMKAAGIAIELTAAYNVAVLELPWEPGTLDQAIDRTHRIGQDYAVIVHYLLAQSTIEENIAALIDKKRNVNSQILDGVEAQQESLISELINQIMEE